jgi:hypothetical protein
MDVIVPERTGRTLILTTGYFGGGGPEDSPA